MAYLDHAATSWPKPAPVLAAVQRWFTEVGTSAERGDGGRCALAAAEVAAARAGLGRLVGWPASRIAFCSGATEGLNLTLRALLRPGDRVLTTAAEHSSVVRPLRALQRERGLQIEIAPVDGDGRVDPAVFTHLAAALRPQLCVMTHASNVTGAVLDATALCEAARQHGARSLLDASQSAGHLDLRVGADVVVASVHKGLLAPPALGFVAVRPELDLAPQKQGGTGSSLALDEHPTHWPAAFEAGTPNTPAVFGLAAALRLPPNGHAALAQFAPLELALRAMPDVRVLHPTHGPRLPVLSFVHRRYDPAELGAIFDQHGVHVRTGHHCAPWLHAQLGTEAHGTVRLSTGATSVPADVERALAVLATL